MKLNKSDLQLINVALLRMNNDAYNMMKIACTKGMKKENGDEYTRQDIDQVENAIKAIKTTRSKIANKLGKIRG